MIANAVRVVVVSMFALLVVCGQSFAQSDEAQTHVTDPHFKIAPGYLKRSDLPDSLMLLPPPAPNSAALARDEEADRGAGLQGRGIRPVPAISQA